jgi:hypothetical protein
MEVRKLFQYIYQINNQLFEYSLRTKIRQHFTQNLPLHCFAEGTGQGLHSALPAQRAGGALP